MKHYRHLTQKQRYQTYSLLKTTISQNEIAQIIGVDKLTISREIKCNKCKRGYRPKQAHHLSCTRKANNSQSITTFGWQYVETLLTRKNSPEQITVRLRLLGRKGVLTHERIYQYIYADMRNGGKLYKHLRCQKTYRKQGYVNQDRRCQIKHFADIDHRPLMADKRQITGDYEGDTVIGKNHKGVLVTLVDRTTRETKIRGLKNRKTERVLGPCIDMLSGENSLSINLVNSKECADDNETKHGNLLY